MSASLRGRLERGLRRASSRSVPDARVERRAAVVLVVRPAEGGDTDRPEALFVRRAEVDGDPWSGHTALPGGHRAAPEEDLVATALRELREETGLHVPRRDVLGRLDDLHPRSRRLPSVAVTPFVAWHAGDASIRTNREVTGHLWIPLDALAAPEHRSVLTFRRGGALRAFPTIEYGGHTIWGLTYLVVARFLAAVAPEDRR